MDVHTKVDKCFIRPSARLNNWIPKFQLYGSGMKSTLNDVHSDWARRRASTIIRRPNPSKYVPCTTRFSQRSQSMDNLNSIFSKNPEVLNFGQKRQLVSEQIRANRMSCDKVVARSRGLYCLVPDRPINIASEISGKLQPNESNISDNNDHQNDSPGKWSGGHQLSKEQLRKEQECLRVFYSSLTTEVLSAPIPVELCVRRIDGSAMKSVLLHSTESEEWQLVGHGRLVVIAQYDHQLSSELSSIILQLCQPKIFSPLWSGCLALPKTSVKSNEPRHRSLFITRHNIESDPQLSSLLYDRSVEGEPTHFAVVYQNMSRDPSNRKKVFRTYRTKDAVLMDSKEYMISRWRFDCCDRSSQSYEMNALETFFRDVQELIDRASSHRLASKSSKSDHRPVRSEAGRQVKWNYRRSYQGKQLIYKNEISSPCMFQHLTSLKPEEVDQYRRRPIGSVGLGIYRSGTTNGSDTRTAGFGRTG